MSRKQEQAGTSRRQKDNLREGMIDYVTESLNENSVDLDLKSTVEILRIINAEDKKVAFAVEEQIPRIASAVKLLVASLKNNGRAFYIGAGTDGRMGVIDAAECPPTFGTSPETIQAIMAGGKEAVFRAQEWVEDEGRTGAGALLEKKPAKGDVLVGLSADGRQDFVLDAIRVARETGLKIIVLTHNPDSEMEKLADVAIVPIVGPEVLLGSTRMKAGITQKMVLTMLSTAAMVKLGRTYGNLMVNIKSKNNKLTERAKRIVRLITGVSYERAAELLKETEGDIKAAVVMVKKNVANDEALGILENAGGDLRRVID